MEADKGKELSGFETPYYIIDEEALGKDAALLLTSLKGSWGENVIPAYSVKTNPAPWLLGFFLRHGFYAEVVSDMEAELSGRLQFSASRMIYNGPVKDRKWFEKIIREGGYVNIDSAAELKWLSETCIKGAALREDKAAANIGIRVNLAPGKVSKADTPADDEGSRFGFSYENGALKEAIGIIRDVCGAEVKGLHLHMSTKTRSVEWYRGLARWAVRIADEYGLDLSYVDMGGGFFGGVPGKPTFADYIPAIASELKKGFDPEKVTLIAEPGISLVSTGVKLVTKALDVRTVGDRNYIVTDGSRLFLNPQVTRREYPHHMIYADDSGERDTIPLQMICGHTCMEYDRLFPIGNGAEIREGDLIIYDRAGGYTSALSPEAFIRKKPRVYVRRTDGSICPGDTEDAG